MPGASASIPRWPIDPDQVRHQLGGRTAGTADIIRSLCEYGLKARLVSAPWSRLPAMALARVAVPADQRFVIIAKALEDKLLLNDPAAGGTRSVTRSDLEAT